MKPTDFDQTITKPLCFLAFLVLDPLAPEIGNHKKDENPEETSAAILRAFFELKPNPLRLGGVEA